MRLKLVILPFLIVIVLDGRQPACVLCLGKWQNLCVYGRRFFSFHRVRKQGFAIEEYFRIVIEQNAAYGRGEI